MTCLPFTFCLTVWCCCECWRRTCEEPDSGQQNGTPAWVFTTPPPFSFSFTRSSWPAAKNTYFLCQVGGALDQRGTKHIKSPRMEYVVVFDQVSQCCQILRSTKERLPLFPQSFHFCSSQDTSLYASFCLSYFEFRLFVSHNSASHELVMRITAFI